MKTTTFDSSGNPTGSTETGSAGGSGLSRGGAKMGTFWSAGTMPTSDAPFIELIRKNGATDQEVMEAAYISTGTGYLNIATLYSNGGTSGSDVIMTVYKNGNATACTATANVAGQGVPGQPFYGNGGAGFPCVKGDLWKVKIRSSNASVNQSFSAALEFIYT